MSEQGNNSAYRAALEAARGDINEIMDAMTRLNERKDLLAKAVDALKPFIETTEAIVAEVALPVEANVDRPREATEAKVFELQPAADPFARVKRSGEQSSDPLQKHIDHALGMLATA